MPFPRKLLTPGEEVVVEAYPNWSVLARPITLTLLVLAGCVAVIVFWTSAPIALLYAAGIVSAAVLAWLGGKVVAWRSRLLVITTNRVVYRWGIVRRTGREIPLDRVQDVTYHQTLFERLVGAGSLTIESAGRSGQEPFPDVRHPARMQSLINQLLSGGSPGRGARDLDRPPDTDEVTPVAARATGPVQPRDLGEAMRDLERLHELGVVTKEEFDRKRRQLLGLE